MKVKKAKPALVVNFGKRIRAIREEQGLSQEALGQKAGLHRTYISLIERGHKSVTLESMEKIAKALGIHMRRLLPEG